MKKTENKTNSSDKGEVTKKEANKSTKKVGMICSWYKKNKVLAIGIFAVMVAFLGGYYFKGMIIAATVNGKPIWRYSVVKQLEQYQGSSLLNSLIDQQLIKQEAKEKGVEPTEEELAEQVKQVEDSVIAQGNNLDDILKEQGMSRKDLEENLAMNVIIEKLLLQQVVVTDEEVQSYIDENEDSFPEDTDIEQIKTLVRQQLEQEKMGTQYQIWLQSLRDKADINITANYQ
ncbi:SurA N-terminal domain-containing protein [Patescibacteria group bacterium]|nr:SurA N-terminal domain-containing protein [Patescibacteria group bacterium]